MAEDVGGRTQPGQESLEGGDRKKRVELVSARRGVAFVMAKYGLSERQACKLLEVDRSSYRYEARPDRNSELRKRLVVRAQKKPRYG